MEWKIVFTKKISYLIFCAGLGLSAQSIMASGYHFGTQSVSSQATANASSAEAGDASTIFYNSAGMTKLEGTHFSGNLNFVMPYARHYRGEGQYQPSGESIKGQTQGVITPDVVVAPHGYVTHQLNDRFTIGLGVYVPFGSETGYDADSVLRYNVNKTELMTIDINPTIAFKATENHSFGLGVIAQYTRAELRQYANFSAFSGYNGMADGRADVKGSDWGFGFNASWLWDITPEARVGINYRSRVKHKLKGSAKWSAVNPSPMLNGTMSQFGYMENEDASVKIETPESLSVHGMYKVNPRWNLFGDITWTRHSRFDNVDIIYENEKTIAFDQGTGKKIKSNKTRLSPNWKNTFKFAVGASYQVSKPWQLRFGVAYDQTPVPNPESRLTTIPDNDRIWLSLGAKYDLNDHSSINFAYSYLHIKSSEVKANGYCGTGSYGAADCVSSKTTSNAKFKNRAQIFGLQYNYNF